MANCSDPEAPDPSRCPGVGFYSAAQRVELSCSEDSITLPAVGQTVFGRVFSLISQEDADSQALAKATQLAQIARDAAPCVYVNDEVSYTAVCTDDAEETSTATIPAGTFQSEISKSDANALALQAAIDEAEATLSCLFPNLAQTYEASCPEDTVGSPVSVTIAAASYFSYDSQDDANAKALAAAQAQAEAALVCRWENEEVSYTASCSNGQTGSDSEYTVEAGEFSSLASQADANAQALAYAQVQAIAGLTCVWENTEQTFTATCPGSIVDGDISPAGAQIGDEVTVVVPAGDYTSTVSQEDADAQALAAAQDSAELDLECYWANSPQSFTAVCPEGYFGDPVLVTIPVATYTSEDSQADADEQALDAATEQAEEDLECFLCPTTLPSVQYDSAEADLEKCGYEEFADPSTPPKIYKVMDTEGTEAYAQFGGTGCVPDEYNPLETGTWTGHSVFPSPGCTQTGNIILHSIDYGDCTGEPTGSSDTELSPIKITSGGATNTKTTSHDIQGPIVNPTSTYERDLLQTLSDEYTTSELIGYVQDAIPAFDNDWDDTAGSSRVLDTDELHYLERHAKARAPLAGLGLISGEHYRLYYDIVLTPTVGSPSVLSSAFFDIVYTGGMTHTAEITLPVPDTNGTVTLVLDGWDCGPF